MHATFLHLRDPFRPTVNRDASPILPGKRIRTHLKQKGFINKAGKRIAPYVVMLNGKAVLEKQWGKVVRDNDVLTVANLPRGGNGGSNPLQIVAMIAIIVIAIYAPYAAGYAYGTWQAAAISSAVMFAGSMLMNMLFKPTMPGIGETSREAASPTYTLAAQGNSARLMEAIPVLYGRHRLFPDFAAAPYTEVRGNDQYLYQLFCVTQGECDIEAIRIEDTDISGFEGVEYEVVRPNQRLTLFPSNVVTSINVDSLRMYGPNEGSYAVLGPFVIGAPGTKTNAIGIDVSLPSGGMRIDDKGDQKPVTVNFLFEYQLIDDSGMALGPWTSLLSTSLADINTSTPQRYGYKLDVPLGRYQVRGARTNNAATDTRTADVLVWNTLKAYLEDDNNYGALTLLAVTMKATNQLSSQNSRKINVIATRKLQTWDPVNGWTVLPVATRNPAWAFADIIRNPEYGRKLPDSRMNLPELYRLSQVWASRGDEFNGVFDTTSQLWEALSKVAKVGRAMPMYYAGLIDIIRNEPKTLPTAMFSPANIISNSFNTTYQFADVDTPDYVTIEYIDGDTWASATVDCALPGSVKSKAATIQLMGVTNRDQAWREGITMAASNRDQRRLISLTTEMDGYIPRFGDLVQISHDVPAWGYSGRVLSLNKTTRALITSEPLNFSAGGQHVIAFRRRNGSADGPYVVNPDPLGDPNLAYVQGVLTDIYISNGIREDHTFYQFGPTARAGILAQCLSARPSDQDTVQMSFVNYAPGIFEAENGGDVPIPPPVSNLPTPPQAPIIDRVTLEYTFSVGVQTIVATAANGAQYYEFETSADGGVTWIKWGTNADPHMQVALSPGSWQIRVRGVGTLTGAWTTAIVTVEATTLPLVELETLTASTDYLFGVELDWTLKAGNSGIAKSVEIWHALSNNLGSATKLVDLPVPVSTYVHGNMGPGEQHWYFGRVIDTAGRQGPWFNAGAGVLGQSSSDTSKIIAQLGDEIDETMLSQELQEKINTGAAAAVEVQEITSDLAAMYTIKTQLTVDGRTYIAGIGVGVENNEGVIEAQVLVAASRFAILDPNIAGSAKFPFIVSGGIVYINTAFIANGSITNAKIGNVIQSDNYVGGVQGWSLNKAGSLELNASEAAGRTVVNGFGMYVYDSNLNERVAVGRL